MVDRISEEERKKYETLRNEYKEIRGVIEEQIEELENEIRSKKRYLIRIRPKIPKGEKECSDCGLVSMKYFGFTSDTFQPDLDDPRVEYAPKDKYKCLICGKEEGIQIVLDA